MPDHAKQRVGLRLAVKRPRGIEYFVAAVLGIRLSKHHELCITRISLQSRKALFQVIQLIA